MRILDFFHACANQRFRSNKIQILEHNGSELTNHDQKAHVLHAFYHSLLGCSYPTVWNFQLSDIYPENTTPLTCLDTPFCASEISLAFRHMHSNASPALMVLVPPSLRLLGTLFLHTFTLYSILSIITRLTLSASTGPTLSCCLKKAVPALLLTSGLLLSKILQLKASLKCSRPVSNLLSPL